MKSDYIVIAIIVLLIIVLLVYEMKKLKKNLPGESKGCMNCNRTLDLSTNKSDISGTVTQKSFKIIRDITYLPADRVIDFK